MYCVFLFRWIDESVRILIDLRDIDWALLVSKKPSVSLSKVERYFTSICVVMSAMLRQLIVKTIYEWMKLIHKYAVSNQ